MAQAIYGTADNFEGRTIAVGANGLILVSDDGGATWTSRDSGVGNAFYAIAYGYAYDTPSWVIVGENGLILQSFDGDVWVVAQTFTGQTLYGVAWGGVFLAVGANGSLGLSADLGQVWDVRSSETVFDLYDIQIDLGMYIIVGDEDTVITGQMGMIEAEVVVSEKVNVVQDWHNTGTFQHVFSESIEAADSGGDIHFDYLTEKVSAYDYGQDPVGEFNHTLTDGFGFLSTFLANTRYYRAVVSALNAGDTSSFQLAISLIDGVNVEDVIAFVQLYSGIAVDTASFTSQTSTTGSFNRTVIQSMTVRDRIFISWIALLLEEVDVTDTNESLVEKVARIIERITIQEGFTSAAEFFESLTQALACQDVVSSGKGAEALEDVALTAEILDRANYYERLLLPVLLTATPALTGSLRLPVLESLNLIDAPTTQGILNSLVSEGVAFRLAFNTGDGAYTGWVMNTTTFSVSEYDNYPFNSFAQIQGLYYGTNDNGMYILEGENDAGIPIQARVRLGETNFGKSVEKRLDSVYLGFRSDGSMILKTITEGNIERWYQVRGDTEKLHRQRVHPLAKGVKAVWWEFELTNMAGADFEVSEIEFVPVMLSRSV